MSQLRAWVPGIWFAEGEVQLMPGAYLSTRMTVIRLSDGGLWLHSPIEIDDELAGELKELGQVRYLVSPNLFHHLYLGTAQKRYPQAKLYAPVGLAAKRPDLTIHGTWSDSFAGPWGDEIEHLCLGGMPKLQETIFYHPKTETLLTTDLVFNLQDNIHGWMSHILYRVLGTYKQFKVSPIFTSQIKDKQAFSEGCKGLFGWAFSRIIMAHGRPIDQRAEEYLRVALARWL
ncbi:MAG: DUF4336 domain-containing protein [Myxococcales bacterium]|nr:DUF4336 domain-containing protein [Myxococcales bacterium]MCB9644052.1 DUF4336 domain-containing protein [Myxococcales bacterium]